MIRLTKQADYAILLMIRMAEDDQATPHSARDLSAETHLPLPIAGKILKALARGGLLVSQRGAAGGYRLAEDPSRITVADIIRAIEGPIALTECQSDMTGPCAISSHCASRRKWSRINDVIERTLDGISLAEMARPLTPRELIASGDLVEALSMSAPQAAV